MNDVDHPPARDASRLGWLIAAAVGVSSTVTAIVTTHLVRQTPPAAESSMPATMPMAPIVPAWDRCKDVGSPISILQEDDIDRRGAWPLGETLLGNSEPDSPQHADAVKVTIERDGQDRATVRLTWKAGQLNTHCTLDLDSESHTATMLLVGDDASRVWALVDVRGLVEVSTWKLDGPFVLNVVVSGYAQFESRRDPRMTWRRFKVSIDS